MEYRTAKLQAVNKELLEALQWIGNTAPQAYNERGPQFILDEIIRTAHAAIAKATQS